MMSKVAPCGQLPNDDFLYVELPRITEKTNIFTLIEITRLCPVNESMDHTIDTLPQR